MATPLDVIKELARKGHLDLSHEGKTITIGGKTLELPRNTAKHRANDLAVWAERQLAKLATTEVATKVETKVVTEVKQPEFVKAVELETPVVSDGPDGLVVIAAVPEGTPTDTETVQADADAISGKKPRRKKAAEAAVDDTPAE